MGDLLRLHDLTASAPLAPDELAELLPLLPGGGVPSYLAQAIWVQLIPPGDERSDDEPQQLTAAALHAFFAARLAGKPPLARLRACLCADRPHLEQKDLLPVLSEVVRRHPALEFLHRGSIDFSERYAETVVLRIFFALDPLRANRVPAARLERSGAGRALLEAILRLDGDAGEEINEERSFFSYEHFYVLYCKFWELDDDHDHELSLLDLQSYANYALSRRAALRVFEMRQEPTEHGGMGYADFVWFLLAEEDKSTPSSASFWFRVLDTDGDGQVSMVEMEYFYLEQQARLREVAQEAVGTRDILCQLIDAVKPRGLADAPGASAFTLRDLKASQLCAVVVDTLCNLHKFLSHEAHDVAALREQRATPHLTDWDRWAAAEYARLTEDEGEEADAMAHEMMLTDYGLDELDDQDLRVWNTRLGSSGALESPF